jgi:hypothetical protein
MRMPQKWKLGVLVVGAVVLSIILPVVALAFVFRIIRWLNVILEALYVWVLAATIFLILPAMCFRRCRIWGSIVLVYASFFWGLLIWTECFLYIQYRLGMFWLIFGLISGVVGVIPIAAVAAAWRSDWLYFFGWVVGVAWALGSRFLGAYVGAKAEEAETKAAAAGG